MITIACTRCGRSMKHASESGMGPKCARLVLGSKPPRRRRERRTQPVRDSRTADLFEERLA